MQELLKYIEKKDVDGVKRIMGCMAEWEWRKLKTEIEGAGIDGGFILYMYICTLLTMKRLVCIYTWQP